MYDCRPANKVYAELVILCNGCGEPMREMGEWPVQYPKADGPQNLHQCFRYACKTCRTPHKEVAAGLPVIVTIIGPKA